MKWKQENPKLFLVCPGLGRVQRGFESYINDLANKLHNNPPLIDLTVLGGGKLVNTTYPYKQIVNISRNNKWLHFFFHSKSDFFLIEQLSFFFMMMPYVIIQKPKAIYLGEYNLYCYLFKIRKILQLKFSLVLYTGGQATPGLFDKGKDYVHHVTDVYYQQLIKQNIPAERQFIIPHFINEDFIIDQQLIAQIKVKASQKKIILSVGYIDKKIKRMDFFVQTIANLSENIFPVILGEFSSDTPAIEKMLNEYFGNEGYILTKVPRSELGTYYTVADVFMLCSPKESFGLANVEALYFGLPVICDDFPELRFVLRSFANFVKMNDANLLSNTLQKIMNEKKEEKYLHRQQFITENYTWGSLSGKYMSMFKRIIFN